MRLRHNSIPVHAFLYTKKGNSPAPNYFSGTHQSCMILEAKEDQVRLALGWETSKEYQVL